MVKKRFSDRIGVTKPSQLLQLSGMSSSLRSRLWNVLREDTLSYSPGYYDRPLSIFQHVADRFLKVPLDDVPNQASAQVWYLHELFFKEWRWYDVYNFVEFIVDTYENVEECRPPEAFDSFVRKVNMILEDELSGYRIVGRTIAPLTNEVEIGSIQDTLSSVKNRFDGARTHFETALQLFSKRPDPDYRNSIKEAISAVESLMTTITGEKDFARALRMSREKLNLHPALVGALEKLYSYTSDEDGIRHGIFDAPDVGFDEAKFMLVTCSALVNFVISKAKES